MTRNRKQKQIAPASSLDTAGARDTPIAPRQEFTIGGRKVFVFDDIFTDEFVESFGIFLLRQDYQPRPSFDNELSAALSVDFIQSLPALPAVTEFLLARYYAQMSPAPRKQTLSHGYAAAIRFGDSCSVHQDVPCGDCVSFLYYGNLIWRGGWAGETVFYEDDYSAAFAVSPRPGRLVLFNAAIQHRGGAPSRDCPTFRYTFSLFFRCKPMLDQYSQRSREATSAKKPA